MGLQAAKLGVTPDQRVLGLSRGWLRCLVKRGVSPPESPGINLSAKRIDRAQRPMMVPVNRQALTLLPAANGRDITVQIGRDFLP
jgi:hypothetical protein